MQKPQEEGLLFNFSVDEMLQINDVMISNFGGDKPDFIAKVSDLNDPFLDNWKNDTDSLSTIKLDSNFIDTQLLMTQAVDELMVIGRDLLQTIYFYVERAYPGNKAVLSYFGKDRYESSRIIPQKLIDLMLKCSDACAKEDYNNAIVAKGFGKHIIDETKNTERSNQARSISKDSAKIKIMVIPTNEEYIIARDVIEIVRGGKK